MKEQIQKSIKLEKNENDLSIRILVLESNIEDNQFVGSMLKSEDEMKKSLTQFLNEEKTIDCDIEINQDEKFVEIKLKDKEIWEKTYNLFNDMFFGDYLKNMIEALMGAFGGMFGAGDDFKL